MFDKVFNQTSAEDKTSALHKGPIFHTVEYELAGIVNKIKNIDNLNEKEIKDIICRQHQMILNYDLFLENNETRTQAQTLFTSENFLRCFIDVARVLNLSKHEIVCINKLAYDYYIFPNKDEKISELLYQLCSEINGSEVILLSSILGITEAKVLSMIRNSSFKDDICVHRVNTYILKCDNEIPVRNLISIYCYLFERFSTLFIYTMLEAKPQFITEVENTRFDNISIAMLEILNSLSSADILKVLRDYEFMVNTAKSTTTTRFALKTAVAFTRIQYVIKENCIKIP